MGFVVNGAKAVGAWIDAKINKWKREDVETRAEETVKKANDDSVNLSTAVAKEAGAVGQLQHDLAKAKENQATWDKRAQLAAGSGDDAALKSAVKNKAIYDAQVQKLEAAIAANQGRLDSHKEQAQDVAMRAKETQADAGILVARHQVATASEEVAKTQAGIDSSGNSLNQLERTVVGKEAEAQAINDMTGQTDEQKFRKMEQDAATSDMMAKYKAAAAAKAPAAAPPPAEHVNGEQWNVSK